MGGTYAKTIYLMEVEQIAPITDAEKVKFDAMRDEMIEFILIRMQEASNDLQNETE